MWSHLHALVSRHAVLTAPSSPFRSELHQSKQQAINAWTIFLAASGVSDRIVGHNWSQKWEFIKRCYKGVKRSWKCQFMPCRPNKIVLCSVHFELWVWWTMKRVVGRSFQTLDSEAAEIIVLVWGTNRSSCVAEWRWRRPDYTGRMKQLIVNTCKCRWWYCSLMNW